MRSFGLRWNSSRPKEFVMIHAESNRVEVMLDLVQAEGSDIDGFVSVSIRSYRSTCLVHMEQQ